MRKYGQRSNVDVGGQDLEGGNNQSDLNVGYCHISHILD